MNDLLNLVLLVAFVSIMVMFNFKLRKFKNVYIIPISCLLWYGFNVLIGNDLLKLENYENKKFDVIKTDSFVCRIGDKKGCYYNSEGGCLVPVPEDGNCPNTADEYKKRVVNIKPAIK